MPPPRRGRKGARGVVTALQQFRGYKFSPTQDPPATIIAPWCPIVLTFDLKFPITPEQPDVESGLFRVFGSEIRSRLFTQLGIQLQSVNVLVRVQRISVWKLSAGPLGLLPTNPFDGDDSNALTQIEDSPGLSSWARVGYHFPQMIADRPWCVSSRGSTSHCATVMVGSPPEVAEVLIHLQLLFRYNTSAWPEFGFHRSRGSSCSFERL